MDEVVRFLIGGTVVSAFAAAGDVFKPKSFAGLFGAAPSVALATLSMAATKYGAAYVSAEGHTMVLGAVAMFVYCCLASRLLVRHGTSPLATTTLGLLVWLAVALGLYGLVQRGHAP